MSTDDDGVIDAEIVDSDNLPAVQVSTNPRMDYPRWSEEWWQLASPEVQARRCVAHKTNGDRCLKAAIKGATVCRTHGGATRHIRNAARVRLENAADLMAKQLLGIALTADSEAVKLAAIKDSLDRAGLKPPAEVVLSQGEPSSPFEQVWDSIGGTPGDESQGVSGDYGSAGHHAPPAPAYADIGYADAHPVADEHREPFSDSVPPREA
ncbi:hypothetical protein, partial [Mycobacterium sp. 852002-51163_SCH5372311]|uniref:hypothetical protein n=1 Tax=Mycobacterium sp. 852002-51163_SCH5372311 TaxID=1834097 RepID=UPI0012E793DC